MDLNTPLYALDLKLSTASCLIMPKMYIFIDYLNDNQFHFVKWP